MTAPDVSLIIGAYNAMPYLTECLRSAVDQTIGRDRMEIVVVDDGSTDGTGEEIDRFAAAFPGLFQVVHQANSGGPSAPRNRGLELARGRYVFFLDADDHLGTEALERLVATADRVGSDVVLGKVAGVNRGVPASMFPADQDHADLFTSRVWWTLSAYKLFRRSLVGDLRFPTHYRIGEDQLFVARALLAARTISVVASYDCYYLVRRDDGGNITARDTDMVSRLAFLEEMCELVTASVPDPARRTHLLTRQFGHDLASFTGMRTLRKPEAERAALLDTARGIIDRYGSEELLARLQASVRVRFALIAQGRYDEAMAVLRSAPKKVPEAVTVEQGVAYLRSPAFRDPELALPDALFDATRELRTEQAVTALELDADGLRVAGTAGFTAELDVAQGVELVLRERVTRRRHVVAASVESGDGTQRFRGTIGPGELPTGGVWDVWLAVTAGELRREVRLAPPEAAGEAALESRFRRRGRAVHARLTTRKGAIALHLAPSTPLRAAFRLLRPAAAS